MNPHIHECTHCDSRTPCRDACELLAGPSRIGEMRRGQPRPCSDCERGIDAVDNLRRPRPRSTRELSGAALVRVVARATRAALAMAARDPEAAPGELARHVEPLAPADPTQRDPDTWYRLGAVLGAKDAWAGSPFRPPPDAPKGEAGCAYVLGWSNAAAVVMQIRTEVSNHG